jgi:hypothetical protein
MLKKAKQLGTSLTPNEMKNLKGGITEEMDACLPGAWGCYQPAFCVRKCGTAYCWNECPSIIS